MIPKPTKKKKDKMTSKTIQKYKSKSVGWLLGAAQRKFNSFIRKRDNLGGYFQCISCGERKGTSGGQYHAGHFYSAGHFSILRFNQDNVHGQCKRCNYFLSGNLDAYRKNLVKKIGAERVEKLDELAAYGKRHIEKWDRFSLIEKLENY